MRVLFLDIDGVLNSETVKRSGGYRDWGLFREHVEVLNELLTRAPDLRLCISSSWRLERSLGQLEAELVAAGAAVAGRLAGATPRGGLESRGAEIGQWLASNAVTAWAVVDDVAEGLEPLPFDRVVLTDAEHGLGPAHVEALLRILGRDVG